MKVEATSAVLQQKNVSEGDTRAIRRTFASVLAWGAAITVASIAGILRTLPPMALGAMIVGWFAVGAVAYFRSPSLRRVADGIGLRNITGFHVWRVAAAFLLFWYGAHQLLPHLFVERAAWGDLVAGVLAGIVFLWPTRAGYWLTHIFGLADLATATATGMILTLQNPLGMKNMTSLPVVLIPLFAVGLTAVTHLAAFDLLLRRKSRQ